MPDVPVQRTGRWWHRRFRHRHVWIVIQSGPSEGGSRCWVCGKEVSA